MLKERKNLVAKLIFGKAVKYNFSYILYIIYRNTGKFIHLQSFIFEDQYVLTK